MSSAPVGDRSAPARLGGESGSALMLVPAGTLIVLLLGSIAVDAAVLHLRQRELVSAAQAAAQDAATFGADPDALRDGVWVIDPDRARVAAEESLRASDVLDRLDRPPTVTILDDTVRVELDGHAEVVFGVIAGGAGTEPIAASAEARAPRR